MMDADHFKKVNDTFGHLAGDQALVHLAKIVTSEIRATDLVGRYGGEEFMLLLPETTLDGAKATAERIRKTLMNTPVVVNGQSIRFTISMGVVSDQAGDNLDLELMLKQADDLLYHAKHAGRNRVMTIKDCQRKYKNSGVVFEADDCANNELSSTPTLQAQPRVRWKSKL